MTLVGPGQRIPLVGAPGEVLVVTGKRGALVPRTLAKEVDGDAVRVSGSEPAVRALASSLNAKVSGQRAVGAAGAGGLREPDWRIQKIAVVGGTSRGPGARRSARPRWR